MEYMLCRFKRHIKISRKEKKSYALLKAVTIINPVMGWFKITQYENKQEMMIMSLVKNTWMTRYPWPTELTYKLGSEFIAYDFNHLLSGNLVQIYNPTINYAYQD